MARLFSETLRGCDSPFCSNISDNSQVSRDFDPVAGAAWLTTPGFHIVERGCHCVGVISDKWHRDKPNPQIAARPARSVWKFFDPNWGMATFGTSADFLGFFNEYMESWVLMPGRGTPLVHHFYFLSRNR